jgi:hypothetical protein
VREETLAVKSGVPTNIAAETEKTKKILNIVHLPSLPFANSQSLEHCHE